jgi:type IV secretion system protein VirB5
MRKILLAGTAALALVSALPVRADLPVIDVTSIGKLLAQIQILQQQLNTLISTYTALAHDVSGVNGLASTLNLPGLQNPLPMTGLMPGAISGITAPSALGGAWSGLAGQYLSYNQVYQPGALGATDWQAQQLQKNANYIASIQAIATQNLQALETRASEIPQIQASLSAASTIQDVTAIQSRLASEQNFVAAQAAQAQNLQLLLVAQREAEEQAQQQYERQDIDQGIQSICTALSSVGGSC